MSVSPGSMWLFSTEYSGRAGSTRQAPKYHDTSARNRSCKAGTLLEKTHGSEQGSGSWESFIGLSATHVLSQGYISPMKTPPGGAQALSQLSQVVRTRFQSGALSRAQTAAHVHAQTWTQHTAIFKMKCCSTCGSATHRSSIWQSKSQTTSLRFGHSAFVSSTMCRPGEADRQCVNLL